MPTPRTVTEPLRRLRETGPWMTTFTFAYCSDCTLSIKGDRSQRSLGFSEIVLKTNFSIKCNDAVLYPCMN